MKKLFILSMLLFVLVFVWTGCVKERFTGESASIAFVESVRKLYVDGPVVISKDDLQLATSISGVVISDPEGGNAPEGLVILQSTRGNTSRGIALNLGEYAGNYYRGDQLIVHVDGKTIDRINGVLQITGLTPADIELKAVNQFPVPALATNTATDITNNMSLWESTLVQLRAAIPDEADEEQPFEGYRTITDWANPVVFYTKPTADFAAELIPEMGDFTGIAMYHEVGGEIKPTIWMRNKLDYVSMPRETHRPGELYENFPEGWEDDTMPHITAVAANATDKYPSGEWLFHRLVRNGGSTIARRSTTRGLLTQQNQDAILAMNFNMPYGASKMSFYVGPATASDTNVGEFSVWYSTDSGNTWTQLDRFSGYRPDTHASPNPDGIPFDRNMAHSLNYKEYPNPQIPLDIKGPVRFRFIAHSAGRGNGARWSIDDIAVYQNAP